MNPIETKQSFCDLHGNFMSNRFTSDGVFSQCPKCRSEKEFGTRWLDNERIIEQNKAKQINKMFNDSCIPPRFKNCSFDNYAITNDKQQSKVDALRQYANDFTNEKSNDLVLIGSVGTGKTHLANAVANNLIVGGYTAVYSTLSGIIDRLYQSGFDKHTELAKYIEPDFLIIDEILAKLPDDTILNLFKIIDGRYMNLKPTCIISNVSIGKLHEVLGERVSDRVLSNAIILEFGWKSYRGK